MKSFFIKVVSVSTPFQCVRFYSLRLEHCTFLPCGMNSCWGHCNASSSRSEVCFSILCFSLLQQYNGQSSMEQFATRFLLKEVITRQTLGSLQRPWVEPV